MFYVYALNIVKLMIIHDSNESKTVFKNIQFTEYPSSCNFAFVLCCFTCVALVMFAEKYFKSITISGVHCSPEAVLQPATPAIQSSCLHT